MALSTFTLLCNHCPHPSLEDAGLLGPSPLALEAASEVCINVLLTIRVLRGDGLISHTEYLPEPGVELWCVLRNTRIGLPSSPSLTVIFFFFFPLLFHSILLSRGNPTASGQAAEDEVGADVEADGRAGADGHAVHILS